MYRAGVFGLELLVSAAFASLFLGGSTVLWVASRRRARAARALHAGEAMETLDPDARADLVRMQRALQRSRGQPLEGGEVALGHQGEVSPADPDSGGTDPDPPKT